MKHILRIAIILFFFCASACAPDDTPKTVYTPSPLQSTSKPEPVPTEALPVQSPTAIPNLLGSAPFIQDSPFCESEDAAGQFLFDCSEDKLTVTESENRRGSNILLTRMAAIKTWGFNLHARIASEPADKNKLDRNQYGFYFITENEKTIALRIEGQYFNFEEWYVEGGKEKIRAFNQSYSPAILSAGKMNDIQLVCVADNCDFFANDALAGRFPMGTDGQVQSIGLFTASDWDQRFGTIDIENLSAEPLSPDRPQVQPFILIDDLKMDNGTFSQMGLSGAFSDFESDGFHFSPVIPYGYYGAKASQSMRNVSVSVTVNMDFAPGKPATQYGGVVCRSSNEGMYLAVLRVDGTYTIFRDSVRKPFAMLAKGTVTTITDGRSSNTIRLDCIEETISLYINDELVESFSDAKYDINYGRSGLYTKAGGAAYSDAIIFSDLAIKEIRKQY